MHNIFKIQLSKSIKRGNMRILLFLILKKRPIPPSSPFYSELRSWNLVCKLDRDHKCVFWEFQLFRLIARLVFWSFFPIIWAYFSHNSPQLDLGSCNLVYRFSMGLRCDFWGFQLFTPISTSTPTTLQRRTNFKF